MQIPGTVTTRLTQVEYDIAWDGSSGGQIVLRFDPNLIEGTAAGVTDAALLDAADAYARALAAVVEAHKPSGSTVSVLRTYQGTAGVATGDYLTLP